MKVAVASTDGNEISPHLGRSAVWLVYELEDGRVANREVRRNEQTHHVRGGGQEGAHADRTGPHSHRAICAALADCEAVIAGGMGWRVVEDLKRHGIQSFVVDRMRTPEEAAELFAAGKLDGASLPFCHGDNHEHRHARRTDEDVRQPQTT